MENFEDNEFGLEQNRPPLSDKQKTDDLVESMASDQRLEAPWEIWQKVYIIFSIIGLFIVINHVFYLGLMGNMELKNSYDYFLMTIFLSTSFLIYPGKLAGRKKIRFFRYLNIFLFFLSVAICLFLGSKGYDILTKGWGADAPLYMIVLCAILWFLILEGTRRSGGIAICIVAACISAYPLVAEMMPGLLQGAGFDLKSTIAYHMMSPDSALGLPMTVVGSTLVGYIIFGVILTATGAGDFFLKLAMALLGHTRGGVAKVAVLGSAFFGSLSGSAISNVVTTGSMTIPMMKKTGYPPHYAAAVEACASNGGTLAPPVMGAVAFVMASFLNVSYLTIAITAVVPSFFYYFGLLVQVDGHAAYHDLKGLPKTKLPSISDTLKEGWQYLFAMALLIGLLFFRYETQAPFYVSVFLLIVSTIRKETRITPAKAREILRGILAIMSQLVPLLCAVGMIIGALSMTGVAHAFPSEILRFAGDNIALLVILGALSSFILGMGMTPISVYIFLAVILAPALVEAGLNALAVHFFLLYWGILSFITPPVCMAVYPAASIAGTSAMKSGMVAVRLGAVAFIIPFFFVLNPALIFQGTPSEVLYSISTGLLGIFLLASALEGYLIGVGKIRASKINASSIKSVVSYSLRFTLFLGGFLVAMPEKATDLFGLILSVVVIIIIFISQNWLHNTKKRAS